jgi:tetratricopeptide (TPR) repeat protein
METARETLRIREVENIGTPTANLNYAATLAYLSGNREEARRLDLSGAEAALTGPGKATDLRLAGYVDAVEGRVGAFHQRFQEADELWSVAGNHGTVFNNRQFLAMFDAIVLEDGQGAGARMTQALKDAELADASMDLADAGTMAFFGMTDRAMEIEADWKASTPADAQALYSPQLHRIHGFLALAEGRTDEGLQELRETVREGYEGPFNLGELALAYDRAGRTDLALETFHRYLDAPNVSRLFSDALFLGRTYERMGQLHQARGEREEAEKYYTLFVELWAEADAELQPRVEAAREALAGLGL